MRFIPVLLVFTLAIAVANAQMGMMMSMAGKGAKMAGGSLMNRFFGTTTQALPEGYVGTMLYNAAIKIPGANKLFPRTLRAGGELIVDMEKDIESMQRGLTPFDIDELKPDQQSAITGAADTLANMVPLMRQNMIAMINQMSSLTNIMQIPGIVTGELLNIMTRMGAAFVTMAMNGANMMQIILNMMQGLTDIFWALWAYFKASPMIMVKIVATPFTPFPFSLALAML